MLQPGNSYAGDAHRVENRGQEYRHGCSGGACTAVGASWRLGLRRARALVCARVRRPAVVDWLLRRRCGGRRQASLVRSLVAPLRGCRSADCSGASLQWGQPIDASALESRLRGWPGREVGQRLAQAEQWLEQVAVARDSLEQRSGLEAE